MQQAYVQFKFPKVNKGYQAKVYKMTFIKSCSNHKELGRDHPHGKDKSYAQSCYCSKGCEKT